MSTLKILLGRMDDLESRLMVLERSEYHLKAAREKRRPGKCRWVKDSGCPGGKFWLPNCWGGVNGGPSGCICP